MKIFKNIRKLKFLRLFVIIILFYCTNCFGQSITWEKSYLGSRFSSGYSIKQTTDGNYITCGSRFNYGGFIAKLNSYGDTLWVKYLPVTQMFSIVEANDGNYVAIGISIPLYIVKLSPSGSIIWSNYIPEPGYDIYPYHINKTIDNCFIVTGKVETGNPSTIMGYLLKIDNFGIKIWSKIYSAFNGENVFINVIPINNNGFILTGSIRLNNKSQVYIIKANSIGDTVWTKNYGYDQINEGGENTFKTDDNGYFIIGQTNGEDPEKLFFYKTDSLGNLIWSKVYNSPEAHYGLFYGDGAVKTFNNNSYILCGYKYNYPALDTLKTFLLKIDTGGNRIWERNYFTSMNESRGWSVDNCNDSGFIISGQQYINGIPNYSMMHFIKTDKNGEIAPIGIIGNSENIPKNFELYQNFPNPFNPNTTIKFDVAVSSNIKITIYNVNGKLIRILTEKFYKEGRYDIRTEFNDLPSGIYFLQFKSNKGFRKSIKIILLK